ncbi:hypothetical protein B0H21DRAFT_293127 [Amylocystis lapponica]|nr:hypothetical protein B0H21DRAFT_293127 [Amylocystis lapponica]
MRSVILPSLYSDFDIDSFQVMPSFYRGIYNILPATAPMRIPPRRVRKMEFIDRDHTLLKGDKRKAHVRKPRKLNYHEKSPLAHPTRKAKKMYPAMFNSNPPSDSTIFGGHPPSDGIPGAMLRTGKPKAAELVMRLENHQSQLGNHELCIQELETCNAGLTISLEEASLDLLAHQSALRRSEATLLEVLA